MAPRTIADLLKPEPQRWGLRGDPYLWREMRGYFAAAPLPQALAALTDEIASAFLLITGHSMSAEDSFLIERFSHGGMSSGHVSPEFWRETAVPLIQERFTEGQKVVYAHHIKGESAYFHIGSGSEKRARPLKERSPIWRAHVDMRGGFSHVEVTILERHRCPARSRLREMELIKLHQPITNDFGRTSIPPAILDGRPKGSASRCVCGATDCYGAELTAREMRTDQLQSAETRRDDDNEKNEDHD